MKFGFMKYGFMFFLPAFLGTPCRLSGKPSVFLYRFLSFFMFTYKIIQVKHLLQITQKKKRILRIFEKKKKPEIWKDYYPLC